MSPIDMQQEIENLREVVRNLSARIRYLEKLMGSK